MTESADTPTISVVMPFYNGAEYLDEAIQSMADQTFADFEVLLVDDGSEDGAGEVAKRWAEKDSRMKFISPGRVGFVVAENVGIAAATGKFIARMDGDDVSLPDRFSLQVKYLQEHPECVACGGEILFMDPEGRLMCLGGQRLTHDDIVAEYLKGSGMALCHPTAMIRGDVLREIGGYDESFNYLGSDDADLFLRLAAKGKLANLPDVLLKVRRHNQSYTTDGGIDRQKADTKRKEMLERNRTALGFEPVAQSAKEVSGQRFPGNIFSRWAFMAWCGGCYGTSRRYAWKGIKGEGPWKVAWGTLALAWGGPISRAVLYPRYVKSLRQKGISAVKGMVPKELR